MQPCHDNECTVESLQSKLDILDGATYIVVSNGFISCHLDYQNRTGGFNSTVEPPLAHTSTRRTPNVSPKLAISTSIRPL
jgi:hypothetical protein